MKIKKILSVTLLQLKQLYFKEFPYLEEIVQSSQNNEVFKSLLEKKINEIHSGNNNNSSKQILQLIQYDGQIINELSTGEKISIHTITLLWQFLTDNLEKQEIHTDVFIDLFFQLKRLQESPQIHVSSKKGQLNMKRWRCGLDKKVIEMRKTNKERMIHLLIEKIKNRKSTSSRFLFSENMNYDDKYKQVELCRKTSLVGS